jgi:serine/threonine protein kinase
MSPIILNNERRTRIVVDFETCQLIENSFTHQVYYSPCGSLVYKFFIICSVRIWVDELPLEITALLKLKHHDNVIQIVDYFKSPKAFCIVMKKPKYCVNLTDYRKGVRGVNENRAKSFIAQIIRTFLDCRAKGIYHKSITGHTFLVDLDSMKLLLIEFEYADYYETDHHGRINNGLSEFRHPALIHGIGVLLREMLNNSSSFADVTGVSSSCQNFIAQCSMNAEHRPTLSDLSHHPWLSEKDRIDKLLHLFIKFSFFFS